MIFRQLTALGDWTFGRGINCYATKIGAIELNIRTRLLSWKGNCFFALNDWVDWLNRLDKGQEQNLLQELKNVILQSQGVVSIVSFAGVLNRDTRQYVVTFTIETDYGTLFVNGLNLAAGFPTGS